jgi:hypothetical protein
MMNDMSDFPDIYLDSAKHPIIKGWEVGKTYKVEVKLKQMRKTEDQKGTHSGFKIVSIGEYNEKPSDMNLGEHKSYMAKEMKRQIIK